MKLRKNIDESLKSFMENLVSLIPDIQKVFSTQATEYIGYRKSGSLISSHKRCNITGNRHHSVTSEKMKQTKNFGS